MICSLPPNLEEGVDGRTTTPARRRECCWSEQIKQRGVSDVRASLTIERTRDISLASSVRRCWRANAEMTAMKATSVRAQDGRAWEG